MRRGFIATILERDRADAAYPTIRAAIPGMELAQWRRHVAAASVDRSRRGIMVVENERGYIHALCCYRVDLDLRRGRTLAIDHFIVLGILGDRVVVRLLIEAVERQALALGCTAMQIRVPRNATEKPEDHPLASSLAASGYAVESLHLAKLLGTTPA